MKVSAPFILLFLAAVVTGADDHISVPHYNSSALLLTTINEERTESGLRAFQEEPLFTAVAAEYAREIIIENHFSHTSVKGERAIERLRKRGGNVLAAGEALGIGKSALDIAEAWLNSPSHRDILMSDRWTRAGVGTAETGEGRLVAVFVAGEIRFSDINVRFTGEGVQFSAHFEGNSIPVLEINGDMINCTRGTSPREGDTVTFLYPEYSSVYSIRMGYTSGDRQYFCQNITVVR